MNIANRNGSRLGMTTDERHVAVDDNRTQHVRLSFAMHRLESCLGHAAPGRLDAWCDEVLSAFDLFITAMRESQECVASKHGLVEDIKTRFPQLLHRVEELKNEFDGLLEQSISLQKEISKIKNTNHANFADLRQRLGWLLTAVKHQQAKEVDLVYEALNVDIGVGD